jgi:short-subunit dehydrogenase
MPRPVAAITGASSGIGAVFARKLAPSHDLILIARRRDRLEQLAAELGRDRVEVLPADLASESDTGAVARRLSAEGRLELLVNNAGFGSRGHFWETDETGQENMHRVHVMATLRLTRAALTGMVARDRGGIINVSSVAAFIRSAGSVSYCATKSWIAVFTEGLHLELHAAGSRVKVQALCPGYTYSEFHDVLEVDRARIANPLLWMTAEKVVDASLRALARDRLFVVPGWPYRLAVAVVPKLPAGFRVWLERHLTRSRHRELRNSAGRAGFR